MRTAYCSSYFLSFLFSRTARYFSKQSEALHPSIRSCHYLIQRPPLQLETREDAASSVQLGWFLSYRHVLHRCWYGPAPYQLSTTDHGLKRSRRASVLRQLYIDNQYRPGYEEPQQGFSRVCDWKQQEGLAKGLAVRNTFQSRHAWLPHNCQRNDVAAI